MKNTTIGLLCALLLVGCTANTNTEPPLAFYDALLAKQMLAIDSQAYRNIAELAASDSLRYSKGEISEIDMLQSRLEQVRALQQLNGRRTEYRNALTVLEEYCGQSAHWTDVEGRLAQPDLQRDTARIRHIALRQHGRPGRTAARRGTIENINSYYVSFFSYLCSFEKIQQIDAKH